jgi:hypothetical protein
MQELAKSFLEYFDFVFTDAGLQVRLVDDAPSGLLDLTHRAGAREDPTLLICVYEGLSCIAEADSPFCCEIDAKVCPPDLFYRLMDELMRMAASE